MAVELFEKMNTRAILVRGGNATALARGMLKAIREGCLLVATIDNVTAGPRGMPCRIFGRQVGFPAWAVEMAARRAVPMVPAWFSSVDGRIECSFGEPMVAEDPRRLLEHYVDFLESHILADAPSWAYLADRKWRAVLGAAAASPAATGAEEAAGA